MADGLLAAGARIEELEDGLIVDGSGGAPLAGGNRVNPALDHRIAMSFAILSLATKAPVTVADRAPIATSFPDFPTLMQAMGASED